MVWAQNMADSSHGFVIEHEYAQKPLIRFEVTWSHAVCGFLLWGGRLSNPSVRHREGRLKHRKSGCRMSLPLVTLKPGKNVRGRSITCTSRSMSVREGCLQAWQVPCPSQSRGHNRLVFRPYKYMNSAIHDLRYSCIHAREAR
jgi:hypothetical protein